MPLFVADCPRCNSKNMTFDLTKENHFKTNGWQLWYEVFCICRHCKRSTIFIVSQKESNCTDYLKRKGLSEFTASINDIVKNEGFVSLKDMAAIKPPEYLPPNIDNIFREGAVCMSVKCFNAAGTMFRLCIDLATRSMLPEDNGDGLNHKIRRNLGLRLPWLFDNRKLPEGLRIAKERREARHIKK